jgi:hypothetical protein
MTPDDVLFGYRLRLFSLAADGEPDPGDGLVGTRGTDSPDTVMRCASWPQSSSRSRLHSGRAVTNMGRGEAPDRACAVAVVRKRSLVALGRRAPDLPAVVHGRRRRWSRRPSRGYGSAGSPDRPRG